MNADFCTGIRPVGKKILDGRDRKHAELELQNARRKETREMAKDLESQLASGDRLAQVCVFQEHHS